MLLDNNSSVVSNLTNFTLLQSPTPNQCVISELQLSFWVGPSRIQKAVDIMIPPHMLPRFNDILASINLKSEVYISNVQQ